MTRELLCAAASECCISAFEKVTPDLTFVVGPCPLRARPSHGTERPWTSYSAISPFSDSTSNGGCRFSGVWPRCTRFGSLDTGREIRDEARGNSHAWRPAGLGAAVQQQFPPQTSSPITPKATFTRRRLTGRVCEFLRSFWPIVNPQTCRFGGRLPPGSPPTEFRPRPWPPLTPGPSFGTAPARLRVLRSALRVRRSACALSRSCHVFVEQRTAVITQLS